MNAYNWRARAAGAALAIGAAACGNTLTSDLLPSGTYTLTFVDGAPLPFRSSTTITVRGSLELESRGQYTLAQTDSAAFGGAVTQFRSSGTWSLQSSALILREGDNIILGVMITPDTLRVNLTTHMNTYIRK